MMSSYKCLRCGVVVADGDRREHSASKQHVANGGERKVVESDYELLPLDSDEESLPPEGDVGTDGSSWTR